jgi:hypothetical protein
MRSHKHSLRLAIGAAVILGACAPVVMKTPVSGSRPSVSRLAGDWQGDYYSVESGRRGVISFHLKAGADTAEGDVIMQPTSDADPSAPNAAPTPWDAARAVNQVLSIRFAFATDTEVTGVLNAYRDPNCGCQLTTTFRGTIKGDVIEGTFHTEGEGTSHVPTDGRWRVKRYAR